MVLHLIEVGAAAQSWLQGLGWGSGLIGVEVQGSDRPDLRQTRAARAAWTVNSNAKCRSLLDLPRSTGGCTLKFCFCIHLSALKQ